MRTAAAVAPLDLAPEGLVPLTANIQADLGLGPINYLIWQARTPPCISAYLDASLL